MSLITSVARRVVHLFMRDFAYHRATEILLSHVFGSRLYVVSFIDDTMGLYSVCVDFHLLAPTSTFTVVVCSFHSHTMREQQY